MAIETRKYVMVKAAAFLRSALIGLVMYFRNTMCKHTFDIKQLSLTGIPEPEQPKDRWKLKEWEEYFREYWDGDWNKKRVVWPCSKCGTKFYAHCGLDISPKHGFMFRSKLDT